MYGYIYKLEIPTSDGIKLYFGQHACKTYPNIDERYIGSGIILDNWIKSKIKNIKNTSYLTKYNREYLFSIGLKREILFWCKNIQELNQKEFEIVNLHFNKDYCWNKRPGGNQSGYTEEHKNKISLSNKGKIISEETKEKLRNVNFWWKYKLKGRIISQETKNKLRKANIGKRYSDEINKKKGRIPWNKGLTKENNIIVNQMAIKTSLSKKDKKLSNSHRLNIIKSLIGHKQSDSQKSIMSKKHKGSGNPAYGRKWWNDGKIQLFRKECPGENFIKGQLKRKKSSL